MTLITHETPHGNSHPQKQQAAPAIVAEWPIKRGEVVRGSIEKYNGVWLINLRKWYEAEDGELRPGKHGIALAVKHLPRLSEAFNEALHTAQHRGLIELPTGGVTRETDALR